LRTSATGILAAELGRLAVGLAEPTELGEPSDPTERRFVTEA